MGVALKLFSLLTALTWFQLMADVKAGTENKLFAEKAVKERLKLQMEDTLESVEFEPTNDIVPRHGLHSRRRRDTRPKVKFINKSGREVYIVYMTYYGYAQPYLFLRRHEKKQIRSSIGTTWYAYDTFRAYNMLTNGKHNFVVLHKHAGRSIDVVVTSRKGEKPKVSNKKIPQKYLEIMVIADSSVYEKYGNETEKYILTIMNAAKRFYTKKSLGVPLKLAVTRIKILKKKTDDLKIIPNKPLTSMKNALRFARSFNHLSDDDDRHFDFGVVFTRKKFGYAGYTPMFHMCNNKLASTLIREKGFVTAHVVAHEILHSLGVEHDGQYNDCKADGRRGALMGSVVWSRFDNYYWSKCSKQQLKETIGYFGCLNDKPKKEITRYMTKLPGQNFDRDQQCKLRYAEHYKDCSMFFSSYYGCRSTHCAPDWAKDRSHCSYNSRPPLDGSSCNNGKGWCIKGRCYRYGRFTYDPIHGGWSSWSVWSLCSSDCGIGIKYRHRKCTNPAPRFKGRDCEGSDRQKMACKLKECEIVKAVKDRRNQVCNSLKSDTWYWFTEEEMSEKVASISGLNCTFEGNCTWTQYDKEEFDWTLHKGSTPSHGTGPRDDHTIANETGHYMYIEASSGEGNAYRGQGHRARLMSPQINVPRVCFTFYYHMLGSHLGSLNVYKRVDGNDISIWNQTKEQGDKWYKAEISIASEKAFEIHMEGVRGDHYQGDIAIDDLAITAGSCNSDKVNDSHVCSITCTNAEMTVFMPNVTLPDTYKCHADARKDMCLSSRCEKLGCDLQFNSNKTMDDCLVCGGNGSTCDFIKQIKTIKLNSKGKRNHSYFTIRNETITNIKSDLKKKLLIL
eukprot:Seg1865.11 transcript_id=Seg1865.11/GoldUCD/mRNA.D3Y31 product="A disintegrin and metalloproteinase with thrombospondin motifs 3" protein_id=Seg1865.11/GoldUCD/D3Y31